jgi:CRP/FNR family cyclic AMP-dependent transcriptional regulator
MRWAILDAVEPEQARALLAVARRKKFARGEPIVTEGEYGDTLYLLEQGKVAVRVSTPDGEVATLRILMAGDVFGELAVISPARRNATLVALEDVAVRTVDRDQFAALRARNPAVDQVLVQALAAEVRRLSRQVLTLMHVPAPQRIAGCLLDLADAYATAPGPVTITLSQADVAELCGLTRQSTNQLLKQLAERGLVSVSRGRIVVLSQDGLLDLVRTG